MSEKNLIIVRSFFAHRIGALTRVAAELALRMNDEGYETHILTDVSGDNDNKRWFEDRLVVHTVPNQGVLGTYRGFAEFAENNGYDQVFMHSSLLGLVLFAISLRFKFSLKLNVLIYTRKPVFSDFSRITRKEFFEQFSRIFFRNFFFGFFLPDRLITAALGMAEYVFVPSYDLGKYYSRFHKKVVPVAFGMDNEFVARTQNHAACMLVDEIAELKASGVTVMVHSGLATPFRGWQHAVELYKRVKGNAVLYLLLYADEGEHIGQGEIRKAQREAACCSGIHLFSEPLPDLDSIFSFVDIALYYYRYPGDIPECPLTLGELQKNGVVVMCNRLSGIEEMLFDFLPRLSGDIEEDSTMLSNVISGIRDCKTELKTAIESGKLSKWSDCAEAVMSRISKQ